MDNTISASSPFVAIAACPYCFGSCSKYLRQGPSLVRLERKTETKLGERCPDFRVASDPLSPCAASPNVLISVIGLGQHRQRLPRALGGHLYPLARIDTERWETKHETV
jgi:hypothetical protein